MAKNKDLYGIDAVTQFYEQTQIQEKLELM